MSLMDVDLDSAIRRLADRRIEEAMRDGKFDNLPGAGQPIELEPMPADETARMTWWALKILRQNDVIPDEVRWRKRIDSLKGPLAQANDERSVRLLVAQVNGLIRKINTLGTNAINVPLAPVSLEAELRRLHERSQKQPPPRNAAASEVRRCANRLCQSRNSTAARFCRRCGAILGAP